MDGSVQTGRGCKAAAIPQYPLRDTLLPNSLLQRWRTEGEGVPRPAWGEWHDNRRCCWPASLLTSLSLNFLICRMRGINPLTAITIRWYIYMTNILSKQ